MIMNDRRKRQHLEMTRKDPEQDVTSDTKKYAETPTCRIEISHPCPYPLLQHSCLLQTSTLVFSAA